MNETSNEMNEWENEHMKHQMTKRRRKKIKRDKSKSDMTEWENEEAKHTKKNEQIMKGSK